MEKREIKNREVVKLLVETFYVKVRQEKVLGSNFNKIISDWESHLEL